LNREEAKFAKFLERCEATFFVPIVVSSRSSQLRGEKTALKGRQSSAYLRPKIVAEFGLSDWSIIFSTDGL
jgi:hypothetical protein